MYITNHYIYFIIAAGALIIAAVGYVVDTKQDEMSKAKDVPTDDKENANEKAQKEKKK